MPVIAETAAPVVFDWKRWPETEAFVDELIDTALEGNAFAAGLAERMPGETGTQVQGLGRSPGRSRRCRRWPVASRRSATSGSRRRTPWACPSSLIPAGSFPGSRWRRLRRAATERRAWSCRKWRSRSRGWRIFREPTTWGWRSSGYPMGPYRVGRVPRRADDAGRGRAAGLSRVSSRFPASWLAKGG